MPYINIHGHRHEVKLDKPYYINVSVECTGYTPILLESLLPPPPELAEEDKWISAKIMGENRPTRLRSNPKQDSPDYQ